MDQLLDASLAQLRLSALLLTSFSLVALLLSATGFAAKGARLAASAQQHEELFVLLADGRLVVLDPAAGTERAEVALLPPGSTERIGSMARGHGEVFVTTISRAGDATTVLSVSMSDLSSRRLVVLRDSVAYPLVAVGPRTGNIYVLADHQIHVASLDWSTGEKLWQVTLPRDSSRDWLVYSIGISPDEARLYISFHGTRSSGVDWLDLTQVPPRSCDRSRPLYPSSGCIASHGNFAPFGGGIVAATGDGVMVVDSVGSSGRPVSVGLSPANHFMEFALDTSDAIVYGIGSCLSAGGLTMTPLRGTRTFAALVPPRADVCGDAILLSSDKTRLFVSRDRNRSDPGPGEITVVDLNRHAVARRIPLSGRVVKFVTR